MTLAANLTTGTIVDGIRIVNVIDGAAAQYDTEKLVDATVSDASNPIVGGQPYTTHESFILRVPATGNFEDVKGKSIPNGELVEMAFPAGGVAPVDPDNITPAEMAQMELVGGVGGTAPVAVAGTVNNLLGRWEPPAPVNADGNLVTGVDYRTANMMYVAFRLESDAWPRVGIVPMTGSYTGFSDGLLVWLANGHCRVGFVDDDTGTVILDDIGGELEIVWIQFYAIRTYTPQTSAGGDVTITARYKPNTAYVTDDPILEPDPNDGEIYVWRADGDFTSGPEVDFDGTGFTRQEKATNPIGIETHILNSDSTPRLFAGSGIAKAVDITQDSQLMPREFRPALATNIYGTTGSGLIGTAVDPTNGLIYAVRIGRTVTDDTLPSLSSNWIELYPGRVPPNALADILAIPFATMVPFTGSMLYAVDTHELLQWDTSATPENVAPRKTYPAAAEPIPFVQGKWVVISPQPPGGEDSHVLLAEAAATVGTNVVQCSESLTAIKNNYMHWEVYSLSDGFGNPIQSPGAILLTEHLTHDVPFRIDLGGRALVFTPQDNGAGNMTLVNNSANAGQQNLKIFGVKKQTTVVTVDSTALTVDMAGAVAGDGAEFADDGAGGLKLVAKAHQTSANVTLNGTTDADGNTFIPYAGAVTNGYQVEIAPSAGRWVPQNYGDRIDEGIVYFQALWDENLARFELHNVGTTLQNKPYKVTIYGADPVQDAPLRLITSHVPAQITRTNETAITVLTLAIPSAGTWQVNAQCVVEGINDVIPTMRVQNADTTVNLIQGASSTDVGEGNAVFNSVMFTALKAMDFAGPTNLNLNLNWAANDDQQFIFDQDSRTFLQALKVD